MESREVLIKYLQDAEAAERSFEDALAGFAESGEQPEVQSAMRAMSEKARTQHERLAECLRSRGAEPSTMKSWLAHTLAFTPTTAQAGHTAGEKSTQHLMITYAASAAEMAMYESLCAAADQLGDAEVSRLARQLKEEEREDHRIAWQLLEASTVSSFRRATAG